MEKWIGGEFANKCKQYDNKCLSKDIISDAVNNIKSFYKMTYA